jgi:hypothetical protein
VGVCGEGRLLGTESYTLRFPKSLGFLETLKAFIQPETCSLLAGVEEPRKRAPKCT